MGKSQSQKIKTLQRIVRVASKRLREKGLGGVAIADLMKKIGLIVGGFYKHFDSRDDLVLEALRAATGPWEKQFLATEAGGPPATYASLIDSYLNDEHRDHPGKRCLVIALACDITPRQTGWVKNRAELIASLPPQDHAPTRSKAILTVCALIGAVELSRGASDQMLSDEILESMRKILNQVIRTNGTNHSIYDA